MPASRETLTELISERIVQLAATPPEMEVPAEAEQLVDQMLNALENGSIRAAERDDSGNWHAVPWVKRGILLGFRIGRMVDMSSGGHHGEPKLGFFDKHTYPPQLMVLKSGVRIVPGGSAIRRGSYLAPSVVCMPPMYVNVGAYVGAGTMIDSHALVGSCAQIGERVHLSAAAQIGGVLEPVNAAPVVIEDDVLVGGNCGVYEGTIVRAKAVLAAGVVLTRGTPVYDLVRQCVYRAEGERPLEIPPSAVVVPGARSVNTGWGAELGLSLQTPIIVKYRDDHTNLATALEGWLR